MDLDESDCLSPSSMKEEMKEEIEDEETLNDSDTMKILIATDIHLGYEQTTKRGIFLNHC